MKDKIIIALFALTLTACDSTEQEKKTDKPVETVKAEVVPVQAPVVEEIEPAITPAEVKPAEPAVAPVKTEMTGEQVYAKSCVGCHASGAANAPKLGDAAAWKSRIDKGMDALYMSAQKGVPGTAMMAKGTCMACSVTELNAAVDYMVSKAK